MPPLSEWTDEGGREQNVEVGLAGHGQLPSEKNQALSSTRSFVGAYLWVCASDSGVVCKCCMYLT